MKKTVSAFERSFEIVKLFDEPMRSQELLKLLRRMERYWHLPSAIHGVKPEVRHLYRRIECTRNSSVCMLPVSQYADVQAI